MGGGGGRGGSPSRFTNGKIGDHVSRIKEFVLPNREILF